MVHVLVAIVCYFDSRLVEYAVSLVRIVWSSDSTIVV